MSRQEPTLGNLDDLNARPASPRGVNQPDAQPESPTKPPPASAPERKPVAPASTPRPTPASPSESLPSNAAQAGRPAPARAVVAAIAANATNGETKPPERRQVVSAGKSKLFGVRGRMRRIRFITQCSGALLLVAGGAFPAWQTYLKFGTATGLGGTDFVVLAGLAALVLTSLALLVSAFFQRTHDLGRTAWWLVGLLVPAINLLVLFVLTAIPGQRDENRFGAPVRRNSLLLWFAFFLFVLTPIGLVPAGTILFDTHFSR